MQPPRDPPVAVVTFVACAATFIALAGPSVGVRDAGELTTAAYLVDVPHPTGFVVDMVVARALMLVPFGDIAFRANVVVALAMAAACALLARLVWRHSESASRPARLAAAGLAAIAAACTATLLRAGTAFEVYALSLVAALLAIDRIARNDGRALREVALLCGISLLVHTQARPAAVVALAVIGWRERHRLYPRRVMAVAALGIVAALPVLYLVMAARAQRPIDWGDPSNPSRLLAHLTAQRIRLAFAGRMFAAWRIPEDFAHAIRILRDDLGIPMLATGLVGSVVALRHPVMRWLAALGAIDLAYAIVVNPMGIGDRQTLFVTIVAVAGCGAFAIARGGAALARRAGPRVETGIAALCIALAALALVRTDFDYAARADGHSESEILLGGGALAATPVRAIVLCESDDLCGGALYAQYVEGERPDVAVAPRQHLGDGPTWRRIALRIGDNRNAPGAERETRLRWIVSTFPERVRWEQGEVDDQRIARVHLFSGESPVLAAIDSADAGDSDLGARGWFARRDARGAGGRRLAANSLVSVGRRIAAVNIADAIPYWRAALAYDPNDPAAHTNLGVAAARAGRMREAIALTEAALAIDPDRRTAWRNLAEFRRIAGDESGALEAARELARR